MYALFQRDRIAGVSKLVNICLQVGSLSVIFLRYLHILSICCFLQAAGCGESWIAEDVDLEPLGPEEIDQLVHHAIVVYVHHITLTVVSLFYSVGGAHS